MTRPPLILLVDADADDGRLTARLLEDSGAGFGVLHAPDAVTFARYLSEGDFAAVVTEHDLPWSDGPEIVEAVKTRLPSCPVVLFTRGETGELFSRALRAGLDGFLGKTSRGFLELGPLLREILDRSGASLPEGPPQGAAGTGRPEVLKEDVEQFASAVSHDLQEPLHLITRYTQILRERYGESLPSEGSRFLDHMAESAARMQDRIDDVIEYSRTSRRPKSFGSADLSEALDEALRNLRASIEKNQASVERGRLPRIEGDFRQMVQLFQNLVGNAVKFRGEEPPRVRVWADEEEDGWTVRVADNGIGIDSVDAQRVFGVFQRLHPKSEYPGTGIGLSICKKIVERHGGTIGVASEPGKGATFSVRFPKSRRESGREVFETG